MTRVTVCSASGASLEQGLEPCTRIRTVKDIILRQWRLPHSCQTLFLGSQVLQDSEHLAELCPQGEHLALAVAVSLDEPCRALGGGDAQQQLDALRDLSVLGRQGGDAALTAVHIRLRDVNWRVRQAAVLALTHVAPQHDQHSM